jgi:hypothetical protein
MAQGNAGSWSIYVIHVAWQNEPLFVSGEAHEARKTIFNS